MKMSRFRKLCNLILRTAVKGGVVTADQTYKVYGGFSHGRRRQEVVDALHQAGLMRADVLERKPRTTTWRWKLQATCRTYTCPHCAVFLSGGTCAMWETCARSAVRSAGYGDAGEID